MHPHTGMGRRCRRYFEAIDLLARIPEDLAHLFHGDSEEAPNGKPVGDLWDIGDETVPGGYNFAGEGKTG